MEQSSSQFYLKPRYSVRAEGDFVREMDRVVLESCRFKGLQLCIEGKTKTEKGDRIISMRSDAYFRAGWQVSVRYDFL